MQVDPTLPPGALGLVRKADIEALLRVRQRAHAAPAHRRHSSSRCHVCLRQQESRVLSQARAQVSGSGSSVPPSRTAHRRQKGAWGQSQRAGWRAQDEVIAADAPHPAGDRAAQEPGHPKLLSQEAPMGLSSLFLPFSSWLQTATSSLLKPLSFMN